MNGQAIINFNLGKDKSGCTICKYTGETKLFDDVFNFDWKERPENPFSNSVVLLANTAQMVLGLREFPVTFSGVATFKGTIRFPRK